MDDDTLGKDIVDGRIINWDKMSVEDLEKMKQLYEEKEKEIRKKINEELERDDD